MYVQYHVLRLHPVHLQPDQPQEPTQATGNVFLLLMSNTGALDLQDWRSTVYLQPHDANQEMSYVEVTIAFTEYTVASAWFVQ